MPKIFVYGTLRDGESNHHFLQSASCLLKQAWVHGELFDTDCGYPVMKSHDIEKVIGEVYEVSSSVLASINELEGYQMNGTNNLYERITLDVYNDKGESIKAITYINGRSLSKATNKIAFGDWKVYNYLQKDKLLYYAYGSCMDDERFKKANVDHYFLDVKGMGLLEEHGLRFSHSTADGGKADIVEAEHEHVEGKVYQVSNQAIDYLYKREGVFTNSYRPAVVTVTIDGHRTEVLTFIVIDKNPETPPSILYKTEIIRGGTGFLGKGYLENITSRMNKLCIER